MSRDDHEDLKNTAPLKVGDPKLPQAPAAAGLPTGAGLLKLLGDAYAKDVRGAEDGKWVKLDRPIAGGHQVEVRVAMAGDSAAFKTTMARELQTRGVTPGDLASGQKAKEMLEAYAHTLAKAVIKGIRVVGDTGDGKMPVDDVVALLNRDSFLVEDLMAYAGNRDNYLLNAATEDAAKN